MMEQVKVSLAEQLKQEFMERYNLKEDQVRLEIGIYTKDIALGRQILKDNDRYSTKTEYLKEGAACDNSYGEHVDSLWVYPRNRDDFNE